jgi:hypothetical protein
MSNVSILEELEDDETPFVQPDDELCLQISQQVKKKQFSELQKNDCHSFVTGIKFVCNLLTS